MNYSDLLPELERVLGERLLTPWFQPILDLPGRGIFAYEALIRGPSNSPLHGPLALLKTAEMAGQLARLDLACLDAVLCGHEEHGLDGKLFFNVSPESLLTPEFAPAEILSRLHTAGLQPDRLVLEVIEGTPTFDYAALKEAVDRLREAGLGIAMDDLGEGFASLRLWSELKPAYVKIDRHFISGIHQDPHKHQFVRSIQQIAEAAHAQVVAEGVESRSELAIIKDLGIRFAQGYLIGRPAVLPTRVPHPDAMSCLVNGTVSVFPQGVGRGANQPRAGKLMLPVESVSSDTPSHVVLDKMLEEPELHALAVVDGGTPVGIIHRPALLNRFMHVYGREIYGRRPCSQIMDPDPLVVDKATLIQDLSELVVRKGKQAFTTGFIVTDEGRYAGLGSGFDLMREVTEMQIVAARYANPLTGLPGNVPIQEHLERLLQAGQEFVVAYCDLDLFKPYNDVYGFRRGDDIIRLLAQLLNDEMNGEVDFIGHVGGDDFVVLFQSPDWEARCRCVLDRFDSERRDFFTAEHLEAGGYNSEDRRGRLEFHPLVTLSIGAVIIDPKNFKQHQEVARAASEAKHMAKRRVGSSLFVDQRRQLFTRRPVAPLADPFLEVGV